MVSRVHSVFLMSVVGGALGLSFADTVFKGYNGGLGFIVGFFSFFTVLSCAAIVSDFVRPFVTIKRNGLMSNHNYEIVTENMLQENTQPYLSNTNVIANH